MNDNKPNLPRRKAPRSRRRNRPTTSDPEIDGTHKNSATEAFALASASSGPSRSSQTTAQASPYPVQAPDCSAARAANQPVLGIQPGPDDPTVRFITLHDSSTKQPWIIVRLWPMSSTWNDQMYGWFLDILDLQRQMMPPPDDLAVLQASNGAWIEIRTLEHNCRIAWNREFPSNDEKYFVMEGTRLLVYRGAEVIGEITIPLHSCRRDPFYGKDFHALDFDA
ncbi:hypothetical protein BDP27DRAFT_1428080 [Rhodocollybia butyracea]|uniref:Uncharacterized protein n=1 Tax=Rhodocollybia butyracea TaxID=206335 RepID=A0A9P5PHQ0_9AGAR|nr:hypothetical protein BDP27DRAFT_1428080 [Rhodocollybia butyracea]